MGKYLISLDHFHFLNHVERDDLVHKKLIHQKDWQKPCRCMTKIERVTQDLVFCTFDDILSTGNYIQHFKLP